MTGGRVVVVGSLNADLVLRVDRIPRPGETVLAGSAAEGAGGKGANQALAAARAGAPVAMVGYVGDDVPGARLTGALEAAGVDVTGVRRIEGPTGVAVVLVEEAGENAIVVAPGANAHCSPDLVRAALTGLTPADVVVAQAEIALDAVTEAARVAAAAGARFVLNLAPFAEPPPVLLGLTQVLVLNHHEAAALGRALAAPGEAADTLAAATGAAVVVTRGPGGCDVADAGGRLRVPAISAGPVVDTTGAGDAFTGAFAAALAAGRDLVDAARWGSAAGGLAVAAYGAQGGPASRAAIEALLSGERP